MAAVARRPANLLDKTYGAPVGYAYFDIFNTGARSEICFLLFLATFLNGNNSFCHSSFSQQL